MSLTVEEILKETREWPAEKVGELVGQLANDLHLRAPDIEEAWDREIDRRVQQIEAGSVKGIPLEDSLARVKKIAGL